MKRIFFGKIKIYSLIFLLLFCFSSCQNAGIDFSVFLKPFTVEIRWSFDGVELNATCYLGPENSFGERDATLTFNSPSEMKNLEIRRKNGVVTAIYGDIELGKSFCEPFLEIVDILDAKKSFTYLGNRNGEHFFALGDVIWYFSSVDGRLLRIESDTQKIEIVWFQGE